jgi:hypothetical protein
MIWVRLITGTSKLPASKLAAPKAPPALAAGFFMFYFIVG